MQVWHLRPIELIFVNCAAWFVLHMSIACIAMYVPLSLFNENGFFYRMRTWEKQGKLYDYLLNVHSWKKFLPDGAAWFRGGFKKKHVIKKDYAYLHRFVLETCRAECAHWIVLFSSVLFFLWNHPLIALSMIAYGMCANLPCIITQRYNRPQLIRLRDSRKHVV